MFIEIEQKKAWKQFTQRVEEFTCEGEHSPLCPEEQTTSLVCTALPGQTGVDWLLSSILETILRFKDQREESALLRISALSFTAWTRMGFPHEKGRKSETPKPRRRRKSGDRKGKHINNDAGRQAESDPARSPGAG